MGVVLNTGRNIYIHVTDGDGWTVSHCAEGVDPYSSSQREMYIRQHCIEATDEPDNLHEGELARMIGVDLKGIEDLRAAEIFTEHLVRIEGALKGDDADLKRLVKLYRIAADARKNIARTLARSPRWDDAQLGIFRRIRSSFRGVSANDADAVAAKKAVLWEFAEISDGTDFPDGYRPAVKNLQMEYADNFEMAKICSTYECRKLYERLADEDRKASLMYPPGAVPSRRRSIWDAAVTAGIGAGVVVPQGRRSPEPGIRIDAAWWPIDEVGIEASVETYLSHGVETDRFVWRPSIVTDKADRGVVVAPSLTARIAPCGRGLSFDIGAEYRYSTQATVKYLATPGQKSSVQSYEERIAGRTVPKAGITVTPLPFLAWKAHVSYEGDIQSYLMLVRGF